MNLNKKIKGEKTMSIETFNELINELHDNIGSSTSTSASTSTQTWKLTSIYDLDFKNRVNTLLYKKSISLKIDKHPLSILVNFMDFRTMLSMARESRHWSVRIYEQSFPKYDINLDVPYVQININKIFDIERRNARLVEILEKFAIRADWRDNEFFDTEEEHQECLKLLQEAEGLV